MIGDRIIDLLGGDAGLARLTARRIETVDDGLTMMVAEGVRLTITHAPHCWNVVVSGKKFVQGAQAWHEHGDRELRRVVEAVIKAHADSTR